MKGIREGRKFNIFTRVLQRLNLLEPGLQELIAGEPYESVFLKGIPRIYESDWKGKGRQIGRGDIMARDGKIGYSLINYARAGRAVINSPYIRRQIERYKTKSNIYQLQFAMSVVNGLYKQKRISLSNRKRMYSALVEEYLSRK